VKCLFWGAFPIWRLDLLQVSAKKGVKRRLKTQKDIKRQEKTKKDVVALKKVFEKHYQQRLYGDL
jgi:hypothetical protein